MAQYYFTSEGTYGHWDDDNIMADTSKWTMTDWEEVENCLDRERTFVVRGIVNKYASN